VSDIEEMRKDLREARRKIEQLTKVNAALLAACKRAEGALFKMWGELRPTSRTGAVVAELRAAIAKAGEGKP
jgi:Zn-dependent M32 family carboxypeptidase